VAYSTSVKKQKTIAPAPPLSSSSARANKFSRWKRQFKVIKNSVRDIAFRRFIYREVTRIIEKNAQLNVPSAFYDWMRIVYVTDMTISIRRLVDWHKDTISFVRLMEEIMKQPDVITRRRFTQPYKGFLKGFGNRDFDGFAKPGQNILNWRVIGRHRKMLVRSQRTIRGFINKHVAHSNRYGLRKFPTYAELEQCLDTLELLVKKYALLFEQTSLDPVAPVIQYDWKAPFRVAWLPGKEHRTAQLRSQK
jgi:hypothetical protein